MDPIKEGIQKVLDAYDDGWTVSQFVVAMGLERIVGDDVEAICWIYAPVSQPGWMTEKLIEKADEMQHELVDEDLD